MVAHNISGLYMQRLYQMMTYFLPLYHNYKIRETTILAVGCVEVRKAGAMELLQMSQGLGWLW